MSIKLEEEKKYFNKTVIKDLKNYCSHKPLLPLGVWYIPQVIISAEKFKSI